MIPPFGKHKSAPFRIPPRNNLHGKPVHINERLNVIRNKEHRYAAHPKDRVPDHHLIIGKKIYLVSLDLVKRIVSAAGRDVTVDRLILLVRDLLDTLGLAVK